MFTSRQIVTSVLLLTAQFVFAQSASIQQKLTLVQNSYQNGGQFVVDYQVKGAGLPSAKTLAGLNCDVVFDSTALRFTGGSNWLAGLSDSNGYSVNAASNYVDEWNTKAVRIFITAPDVNNDNNISGYDVETEYRTFVRLNFIILDNTKSATLTVKDVTNQVGLFSSPNNLPNTFEITGVTLSPPINIVESPLPVSLSSFTHRVSERNVILNWTTTQEINNKGFGIERKEINGSEWKTIGFVNGGGNTNSVRNYSYEDRKPGSGKYNYRLKQTDNNGNYAYSVLGGAVEIGIPSKYNLSQNYPNPFNPSTKIDFDMPNDGRIKIVLYDATGREVSTVINEDKKAGSYTIDFKPSGLSSGVYFYRMTASGNGRDNIITKKMSFVK